MLKVLATPGHIPEHVDGVVRGPGSLIWEMAGWLHEHIRSTFSRIRAELNIE